MNITSSSKFLSYLILIILVPLYIFIAFQGYGNDMDTYGMLRTWQTLLNEHRYVPSRFQGNLIPEIVIGFSAQLGSFYLSNAVSVILSILTLVIIYKFTANIFEPILCSWAVLAIATNPFWIQSSTTSLDDIYAVFFFICGSYLLFKNQPLISGIMFGLSGVSRINYAPMALIIFIFFLIRYWTVPEAKRRLFLGLIIFLIVNAILFIPSLVHYNLNIAAFLSTGKDRQATFIKEMTRFIYKNIYLWSLPGFFFILYIVVKEFTSRFSKNRNLNSPNYLVVAGKDKKLIIGCLLAIAVFTEAVYAQQPQTIDYLIPVLIVAIFLILLTITPKKAVIYLTVISILNFSYCFFNIALLNIEHKYASTDPTKPRLAESAKLNPQFEDGVIVQNIKNRSIFQAYFTSQIGKH